MIRVCRIACTVAFAFALAQLDVFINGGVGSIPRKVIAALIS